MEQVQAYAQMLHVNKYIDFLGFRKDIGQLIALSDIGISASRQEGLGLNLAEEMYAGLPVVASDDRGHRELVESQVTGYVYPQMDKSAFVRSIIELADNSVLRERMGMNARIKVQHFSLENALQAMSKIYQMYI